MSIAEFYIDHGIDPNEDVCDALRARGLLPDHGMTPDKSSSSSKKNRRSKKRKAETPEPGRTCSECRETKTPDSFSKNQRRKGSKARCRNCVEN